MRTEGITVFSSRATDILIGSDQKNKATVEGGPALFIDRALKDMDVPFLLRESSRLTVEIEVHEDGEYGRIPIVPHQKSIRETSIDTSWCMVSTLLDEWVFQDDLPQFLFVDVQGYVRDGSDFGLKHQWPFSDEVSRRIFCLKGTSEELGYVPAAILAEQKKSRMVVETRGKEGAIIYTDGKTHTLSVQAVQKPVDTIGAGDTFFAYFVGALYKKEEPRAAGEYAARKTAEFLESKDLV